MGTTETKRRGCIKLAWFLILIATSAVNVAAADTIPNTESESLTELFKALDLGCSFCKNLLSTMKSLVDTGMTTENLLDFITELCPNITSMVSEDVCSGAVQVFGPEIIYIVNTTTQSTDVACSLLMHAEHCNSTLPAWSIALPPGKPEVHHPKPEVGPAAIKILHISDPHVDYLYQEGTPVECNQLLCCRDYNDTVGTDGVLAGFWGAEDGACDIPLRTFEAMLEAAALHQPDLVYLTGDHPPHDGWMQTRTTQLDAVRSVNEAVFRVFPNTVVLQSLGNHESVPVNSYPVPAVYADGWSISWLYEYLADTWAQGGIPAENLETVRVGGYYTYSPLPGLRVVSVNMNYCSNWNWWLLIDNVDPTGQLSWLTEVLLAAETAGEKVHILDHISTGSRDCEPIWSHVINTIYTRFESTITGIFSGHHHCDQFRMLWDVEDNTRATGLAYLAPSVTSGWRKSPAFRLFTIDGGHENATWVPLDHETYVMNLTLANQGAPPDFQLSYSAKQAYGLTDLTPSTWAELGWNMATDTNLFNEYLRHYFNYWSEPEELWTCGAECRKELLCAMYRGDSLDLEPCHRIMDQVDAGSRAEI